MLNIRTREGASHKRYFHDTAMSRFNANIITGITSYQAAKIPQQVVMPIFASNAAATPVAVAIEARHRAASHAHV